LKSPLRISSTTNGLVAIRRVILAQRMGDFREKLSITRVEKSDTDLITVMCRKPCA
jgi:hypothetical protein